MSISNSASSVKSKKWMYILLALVFLGIYAVASVAGYEYFFAAKKNSIPTWKGTSTVSGTIDLNGTVPAGAVVAIEAKQTGQSSYQVVATDIEAVDGATWSWHGAQAGQEYNFRALIQDKGNTVVKSNSVGIVAPAQGESLRVNMPSATNAASRVTTTTSTSTTGTPALGNSSLSGIFNINGYVPSTATVTIQARAQGDSNFTVIAQNVPAIDNGVWSWTQAVTETSYEVQAILVYNGANNATSQVITMTAPAANEMLTLNSTLQSPTPAVVSLSGTFNLNGSIPSGSTLNLATRVTGTSQFNTVASGINALNGASWSWAQAASGTTYDVQASLISNGNTISQSQILTVAAPATGEILNLNVTNQPPAPPAGTITNSCGGTSGSPSQFQVSFNYNNNNAVQNAQQFQFQVGTSSGGNQMVSVTNTPSNPNQSQNYTSGFIFTQEQTYYAQYSYATCQNCNTFSAWSPPLQFYCNPAAAPTNTPTPTPTPLPTPTTAPTAAPTSTPVPTATSTPSPTHAAPTATPASLL